MKIKDINVGRTWQGDTTITFTVSKKYDLKPILNITKEELPKYELKLQKTKKKRSLDANAYFWVLVGKLSQKLKIPNIEIYKKYIQDFGPYIIIAVQDCAMETFINKWKSNGIGWIVEKIAACKNTKDSHTLRCYYGSSTYNTEEMAILIDNVVEDCKQQGIETLPPDEIKRMKEMWK